VLLEVPLSTSCSPAALTNTHAEQKGNLDNVPAPCVLAVAVFAGRGPQRYAAALEARPSYAGHLPALLMQDLLTQALTEGAAQQPAG
jgi:hypothetical protein